MTDELPEDARARAARAAHDLVRVSLVAKLAIDLDDPALARRAALAAGAEARLVAGLDWPAEPLTCDEDGAEPRALQDLLVLAYGRRDAEATGEPA